MPVRLRLPLPLGLLAAFACFMPLLLGFLLPAGLLLRMAFLEGDAQFGTRFVELAQNSFVLAAITAMLAVLLAVLLAYAAPGALAPAAGAQPHRRPGLCGARPVIAVGVLIPLTRVDRWLAQGWEAL